MRPTGDAGRPDPPGIARAAGREAGVAPDFLGSYVLAQLDVISTGRRLRAAELAEHGLSGARAAQGGVALPGLVRPYPSAQGRAWPAAGRRGGWPTPWPARSGPGQRHRECGGW